MKHLILLASSALLFSCKTLQEQPSSGKSGEITNTQLTHSSGDESIINGSFSFPLPTYTIRHGEHSFAVGAELEYFSPKMGDIRIDYDRGFASSFNLDLDLEKYLETVPPFPINNYSIQYSFPLLQKKVDMKANYFFRFDNEPNKKFYTRLPVVASFFLSPRIGFHSTFSRALIDLNKERFYEEFGDVTIHWEEEQQLHEQISQYFSLGISLQPFVNSRLTGSSTKGNFESEIVFFSDLYFNVNFLVQNRSNLNPIDYQITWNDQREAMLDLSKYMSPTKFGFSIGYKIIDIKNEDVGFNFTIEGGRFPGYYSESKYANYGQLKLQMSIGRQVNKKRN